MLQLNELLEALQNMQLYLTELREEDPENFYDNLEKVIDEIEQELHPGLQLATDILEDNDNPLRNNLMDAVVIAKMEEAKNEYNPETFLKDLNTSWNIIKATDKDMEIDYTQRIVMSIFKKVLPIMKYIDEDAHGKLQAFISDNDNFPKVIDKVTYN